MKLEVRRSAAAVVSCVILLLLGGCRSDADFSPDAEFVDFSYEVPEFRTGKLEKASDARLLDYTVLPSASGPAVPTTLKRDTDAGNRLCCFSARLTNLDKQGAVRSERDLVTQHAGTHGLTVLPISLDAQSIKLAIVEEMLVQVNPDDRYKTSKRRLWLMEFQRDGTGIDRGPALNLPDGVVVEDGWARDDGTTVLIGTRPLPEETVAWAAVLRPDGTLVWQKSYPSIPRAVVHAHAFEGDDRIVLHARAPRWTDGGVEHILTQRTIDLVTGDVSETSMFGLPKSQLSNSALGKVRPGFAHAHRLPGGDTIMPMTGWFRGGFDKLRVVRIGTDGQIRWINTLIEGEGALVPQFAIDEAGEIVVNGSRNETMMLFRVNFAGEVIAEHRVEGAIIRQIVAHPEGGYLVWVQVEAGERHTRMRLLRVAAWPAE